MSLSSCNVWAAPSRDFPDLVLRLLDRVDMLFVVLEVELYEVSLKNKSSVMLVDLEELFVFFELLVLLNIPNSSMDIVVSLFFVLLLFIALLSKLSLQVLLWDL